MRIHHHHWLSSAAIHKPEGRLLVQTLRPYRLRVLVRSGLEAGRRCVAIGPGALAVALLLAEVVGEAGEVLALEVSADALAGARSLLADGGWTNVELEVVPPADEAPLPLAPASCDLIYAVNLLAVAADLEELPGTLADAVRPGGQVIVEEQDLDDAVASVTSPALHRWRSLRGELARLEAGHSDGAGRAPMLLLHAGLDVEEVETAQPVFLHGRGCEGPLAELDAARRALLEHELLDRAGLEQLRRDLEAETGAPDRLVYWPRTVFVRGRRAEVVDLRRAEWATGALP